MAMKTRLLSPLSQWQSSRALYSGVDRDREVKLHLPKLPKELEGKYKPGQMYRNQASVAKLPVPPLQQTLSKYLTSVEVGRD